MPSALASRVERIATGCAGDADLALVGGIDAGQDLDQRRLAGAVVAEEAEHLAGSEVEARPSRRRGRRRRSWRCRAARRAAAVMRRASAGRRMSIHTARIEHDRQHHLLQRRRHAHQDHAALEALHDHRAERRAVDRADAAGERGAADHRGGDDVELGHGAGDARAGVEPRRDDDRGEPAQEAHQGEHLDVSRRVSMPASSALSGLPPMRDRRGGRSGACGRRPP